MYVTRVFFLPWASKPRNCEGTVVFPPSWRLRPLRGGRLSRGRARRARARARGAGAATSPLSLRASLSLLSNAPSQPWIPTAAHSTASHPQQFPSPSLPPLRADVDKNTHTPPRSHTRAPPALFLVCGEREREREEAGQSSARAAPHAPAEPRPLKGSVAVRPSRAARPPDCPRGAPTREFFRPLSLSP